MRVGLRFMCADLPVPAGRHEIEVMDGATVGQALAAYLEIYPVEDPLQKLPESMFIVGKNPAQIDTVLRDGDELLVMRILHGG